MARLTPERATTLVKLFEKLGYSIERQKGSHIVLSKPGVDRPLVIPNYAEVSVRIIRTLIKTAGLSREEYFQLLKKVK